MQSNGLKDLGLRCKLKKLLPLEFQILRKVSASILREEKNPQNEFNLYFITVQ